jgi:hypothetical protein
MMKLGDHDFRDATLSPPQIYECTEAQQRPITRILMVPMPDNGSKMRKKKALDKRGGGQQ